MARLQTIMYSVCTDPARELEFNRWYTHTHLPDLSKAPGFVTARRFVNVLRNPGAAKYMAVYEFEGEHIAPVLRDLTQLALDAFGCGRHIDCIRGVSAGNTPIGGQWQEIDPASLQPLTTHAYPDADIVTKTAMRGLISYLGNTPHDQIDPAILLGGKQAHPLLTIPRNLWRWLQGRLRGNR